MQASRDLRRRAHALRLVRGRRTLRAPRWLVVSIAAHALAVSAFAAWRAAPAGAGPGARVVAQPRELTFDERADVVAPAEFAQEFEAPALEHLPLEAPREVEVAPVEPPAASPAALPALVERFEPRLERIPQRFGSLARRAARSSATEAPSVEPPPVEPPSAQPAFVAARALSALNAAPDYPRLARARGWEGTSLVEARVGVDGGVLLVRLLESSGIELLDRAALEAVAHWRFEPARLGDAALESLVEAPVVWRLAKR